MFCRRSVAAESDCRLRCSNQLALSTGAYIELHVPTDDLNLKTIVQWQDGIGNWHGIKSWLDMWASEYFAAENDVTVAAQMLDDTVETVLRHYVKPLRKQNTEIADQFVRKAKPG